MSTWPKVDFGRSPKTNDFETNTITRFRVCETNTILTKTTKVTTTKRTKSPKRLKRATRKKRKKHENDGIDNM